VPQVLNNIICECVKSTNKNITIKNYKNENETFSFDCSGCFGIHLLQPKTCIGGAGKRKVLQAITVQ
jgi:hypothetical protein